MKPLAFDNMLFHPRHIIAITEPNDAEWVSANSEDAYRLVRMQTTVGLFEAHIPHRKHVALVADWMDAMDETQTAYIGGRVTITTDGDDYISVRDHDR